MTTNSSDSISMQKIIVMVIFVFLVIIIIAIILAHYNNAFASTTNNDYEFVTCFNENLKVNMTYPEGTECEESEDELEHQQEAEAWDKNGWTKLK